MEYYVNIKFQCCLLFRGMIEPEQAFPYPQVLNTDQFETLQMLVSDIFTHFVV